MNLAVLIRIPVKMIHTEQKFGNDYLSNNWEVPCHHLNPHKTKNPTGWCTFSIPTYVRTIQEDYSVRFSYLHSDCSLCCNVCSLEIFCIFPGGKSSLHCAMHVQVRYAFVIWYRVVPITYSFVSSERPSLALININWTF